MDWNFVYFKKSSRFPNNINPTTSQTSKPKCSRKRRENKPPLHTQNDAKIRNETKTHTKKQTRLTFISVRNWKHPVSPNGSNRDFPAFHFAPFVCCPFLGTAQQEGTEGDGIFKEEKEVKDCFDSARIRCGTPAGVA